jgi:hypothetical protein
MKKLIDVVNFNADASCLTSEAWLSSLKGGTSSPFCEWLKIYVSMGKKVVLGLTGATIADLAVHNPEAIALINKHTDTFEMILRPFTHDIALLRIGKGFEANFTAGHRAITKEFNNISDYYLPPEFMLTSNQLLILHNHKVIGLFINPDRFSKDIRTRISLKPYKVKGLFGTYLNCIPVFGHLTHDYLEALHKFDCSRWNGNILAHHGNLLFTWRDGESALIFPDGLNREAFWLKNEDTHIHRQHIKGSDLEFIPNDSLDDDIYKSYPVHSFLAWMKEFKVLGFVNKVREIEDSLLNLSEYQKFLWLMVISSDILSAIEKRSPVIQIKENPSSDGLQEYTIQRSERGFEGEEFIAILDLAFSSGDSVDYVNKSQDPHMIKLRGRVKYLSDLQLNDHNINKSKQ